ncbi:helix-turn-helix domain-containing protein [Sphingomonas sp. PL-96]|nr:helix-turn-helix domain-containing protein [Sphingomonas sp. PL-96]
MPKITLEEANRGAPGRLNRPEAAAYLGLAASTLADWHRRGIGPNSLKIGGRRFYRVSDLHAFMASEEGR